MILLLVVIYLLGIVPMAHLFNREDLSHAEYVALVWPAVIAVISVAAIIIVGVLGTVELFMKVGQAVRYLARV